MTASPDTLQQRYEAIERVYSERQWDDVARRSEELLLELPDDPGHPLRQRLQLLLGHTYLYGYRDAATATGFYSRVKAATKEPVLRDIADQGLEQCASQTATTPEADAPAEASAPAEPASPAAAGAGAGQAFPFSAEVVNPAPAGSGAIPAMPWMEQLGGSAAMVAATPAAAAEPPAVAEPVPPSTPERTADLVVEVIDEPELIEVAQANPAQAEELEVAVREELPAAVAPVVEHPSEPIPSLSPEEIAELSKGLLRVVIR